MRIKDALIQCANAFLEARQGDRSPAMSAANDFSTALLEALTPSEKIGISTKTGLGMGSFADAPWVAAINEKFGGSGSKGYFVVYLFSKDGKRVYLSVCVGAGSVTSGAWKAADRQRVAQKAALLRSKCGNLNNVGFELSDKIDLGSEGWRAGSYATATAAFKKYEINNMPEPVAVESDFTNAMNFFNSLVKEGFNLESETRNQASPQIPTSKISTSLLTKPFLILTGPSGTGKTRGAVALTKSVCTDACHKLVAVGADWTDNRHVLGYLNPLESDGESRPIYETTPILDLILHANEHPEPHVLILDEMNLSHVERYFADFLSAMELEDKSEALKLHAAGTAVTRTGVPIQSSIDFPSNLFVIGTVNIDETTYMFSPKVLDRANVIEIHAEKTALGNFLKGIESGGGGPEAKDYGISFLDAAHAIQTEEEHAQVPMLPDTVRQAAAAHLIVLFGIMKRGRGEYGFRTGKEVMAYLRTAHFLAGPEPAGRTAWASGENWHEALDAQILQKILPKLHGSRSRLAPLLGALATYCATGWEEDAMEHFPKDGAAPKRNLSAAVAAAKRNAEETSEKPNPKFDKSYEKLCRMIDVLVEEQFVSFIC